MYNICKLQIQDFLVSADVFYTRTILDKYTFFSATLNED